MIVNPYATSVSPALRERVVAAMAAGYRVDAVDTEGPRHATELARQAVGEGFDGVVAFGGDGTVNEAANGIAGESAPCVLACLPGGQANIFAKMLGMPPDALSGCRRLVAMAEDWQPRAVDLGVVNGRCFTFASGLGVDASVTRQVDANPRLKARLGPWYYTWVLASTLLRRYLVSPPSMAAHVPVDGARRQPQTLEGVTTIVQNGSAFTFFKDRPIEIADGGALDSGKLAGCVLRRVHPTDLPSLAYRAISSRARMSTHRQVSGFGNVSELSVSSGDGRPLPLHVDGDFLGEVTEARYSVLPGALRVLA